VGEKKVATVHLSLLSYSPEQFEEKELQSIDELDRYRENPGVNWINVDGIHEVEILEKIGNRFQIHPLILEDILNTDQRPKMEDYDEILFIVLKMLQYNEQERQVEGEQISLLLGSNFVISFQERFGDVFHSVRQRLRTKDSRIRKSGADYLVYRLIDTLVDHYFSILEKLGERIEDLERDIMKDPTPESLQEIYKLKREMMFLRKSTWPLRELLGSLSREDSPLIKESTEIFLRDVYDHTVQVMDTLETFREMVSGMLDVYMSSLSHKMNEVMKLLTLIATIFIPLTFVAGIYGMNFNPESSPWNMPELRWYWGYPAALLAMGVLGIVMLVYFRKRKWL
jgi:magnesium transporter